MASVIRGSGASTLGGALDVQGVLTYEDVTSVDSIGIITARSGINVGTGASISSPDTNELALGTNNVERLRIASGGDVNIGPSANANGHGLLTLSQSASAAFNALVIQQGNTAFTATDGLQIGIDAGVNAYFKLYENRDFYFTTGTSNTEKLRITSTGQLQATGAADVRLTLGSGGTAGTNDSVHMRADGANLLFMNASGGLTKFESNGTETLRITSAGFVQIGDGSFNAEAPLHVISQNSQGINAIFGAKDFIVSNNYNYPDANIALQGRDIGNNDTGAGIQFTVRNTADTNWVHGAITMDQSSNYIFKNSGLGNYVGTEKLRITSGGEVQIANGNLKFSTAGTGIDFSATGQATGMDNELLDDYEEGNWTPGVQSGGWSGINSSGLTAKYVKIGSQVFVQCYFAGFTGSGSGNTMALNGLPFNSISTGYSAGSVDIGKGSQKGMYIRTESDTDRIGFYYPSESSSSRRSPQGNSFYIDGYIILHLSYFTDS